MLKVEFYSVMNGMMVRAYAVPTSGKPLTTQVKWDTVQRVVQVEAIENEGIEEALREAVTDLLRLYPELMKGAIE
jgi:hypothetical protein